MTSFRRAACYVSVAALLAGAACSSGGGKKEAAQDGVVKAACQPVADERPAKAVLRCTEASVAYVETEIATGTGVVVELAGKRYVVTNQHVVDPFDSADATIGGKAYDGLPLVGVDTGADIALLGPLTGTALPKPLAITAGTGLERGDDLFLVGYPGQATDDDLEATISSGIVSRVRSVKEFGHSYIQTDASIGGGQSGGPLFDASANLVGISGLAFAEEFALALTGRDTRAALDRILKGKGSDYLALPGSGKVAGTRGGEPKGTVKISDGTDGQVLFLPASGEERSWHLTVDMKAKPIVSVANSVGDDLLALSGNAADVQGQLIRDLAKSRGGNTQGLPDPAAEGQDPKLKAREKSPGKFEIPVKAGESAIVFLLTPLTDGPVEVAWESDLPLVAASRAVPTETMAVGGTIDRIFGSFDTAIDVLVDLVEGEEYEVYARSPQGDPAFSVFTPGAKLDHLTMADTEGAGIEMFDDTDDGIYGIDAKTILKATATGTYRFRVASADQSAASIRFSVLDCAKATCDRGTKDKAAAKS